MDSMVAAKGDPTGHFFRKKKEEDNNHDRCCATSKRNSKKEEEKIERSMNRSTTQHPGGGFPE